VEWDGAQQPAAGEVDRGSLKNRKAGWRCGSSNRALAQQELRPEFKPQYCKKNQPTKQKP
jgi:hypothetical protein